MRYKLNNKPGEKGGLESHTLYLMYIIPLATEKLLQIDKTQRVQYRYKTIQISRGVYFPLPWLPWVKLDLPLQGVPGLITLLVITFITALVTQSSNRMNYTHKFGTLKWWSKQFLIHRMAQFYFFYRILT